MDHDRIERDILIAAPIQRVWELVSQPGWFIDDGGPRKVELEEGRAVVELARGRFLVVVQRSDPPAYISCRGTPLPGPEPDETNSTLVEFTLVEEAGGTRLRVVESGFSKIAPSPEKRRQMLEGNAQGWAKEFAKVKRLAEGSSV